MRHDPRTETHLTVASPLSVSLPAHTFEHGLKEWKSQDTCLEGPGPRLVRLAEAQLKSKDSSYELLQFLLEI